MNHTSNSLYHHYLSVGGNLSYQDWREVICEFNVVIGKELLSGKEFDMGHHLSRLLVVRHDRTFTKGRVNWKESHQLRTELIAEGLTPKGPENPEGVPWFVYYTDDWFIRFFWNKIHCHVRNKSAFRFDATRGVKGLKTRLKELLVKNPLAYLNYRLI